MSQSIASPSRRKTVSLLERDMNRFDDDNLTLPITKVERTKHKRGVSMGGSMDILSETQKLRRQARPRKSILKSAPDADASRLDDSESPMGAQIVDYGATIDFGQLRQLDAKAPRASMPSQASSHGSSRMSLGPRRRVSFAPAAHVRMFEQPDKKPRRKSSMLPRQFGNSSNVASTDNAVAQSPARSSRSSLPSAPISQPPSAPSPARPPPASPRARFIGEGEELSEASMDVESDQSYSSTVDDSDDILAQVEAISPHRPTTPLPPPHDSSSDVDAEGEMDMDETVIGGGILNQRWADDDTESDSDSDSDMSIEGTEATDATDEEKTMDFTVALGGPMPSAPPQGALRSRASIGYSVPSAAGQQPFLPGDGVSDGESMEMEETAAYGNVYIDESTSSLSDNSNRGGEHTSTYHMDFTTVVGGIHDDESGMDVTMTTVSGGIVYEEHDGGEGQGDESALDFTAAVGGIAYQNTNVYGTTTNTTTMTNVTSNMTTNIFAPVATPAPTAAPARSVSPPKPSTTTAAPRPNIFAPTPAASGIPRPRVSLKPALTPFAPMAAPQPEPEAEIELPSPPRRMRGSSATPARPTPGATTPSRKRQSVSGTPSFARPTSSSSKKAKEHAPSSTQKKRNIFGASPEPEGEQEQLSRSKSRTPRKSAAGIETAASVAKKLDFSAPAPSALGTPKAPTPKQPSVQGTPKPTLSVAASTTPKATPRPSTTPKSAPPSSLKRARTEEETEAEAGEEQVDEDVHRHKRRRSSVEPPKTTTPAIVLPEEEDMEIEASEETPESLDAAEETEPVESEGSERQVTPEMEERPLPTYTPRKSLGTPLKPMGSLRKSLGPPRRSILVVPEPVEEPSQPEPEAEPVEGADLMANLPSQQADTEVQNIPLHAFLEMVGISWQDDLPLRKSLAASRKLDNLKSQFPKGHEFPLPDYVEANLESIFLSMLLWADDEITTKTKQAEETLQSVERVCSERNPAVVHDYLAADEEDRGMFESVLLQIKSVTYLRARARWYDWKDSILNERVFPDVQGIRDDMLDDAERHRAERETIDRVLPNLRKRRDELEAELAAHRAEVEAIMACDQDEIAALREGIEEQDTELERFRAELDGKNTKNAEVEAQLAELNSQRSAHTVAIEAARSMCDQLTVSDVLRLEAELASLQELHGWRILRAGGKLELEYAKELVVSVPCFPEPALDQVNLSLKAEKGPDAGLLAITQSTLGSRKPASLRALVDTVAQLWTAACHVRDELRRLELYYPASYAVDNGHLVVSATIMLPRARSKATMNLTLGADILLTWPEAVRALPIAVSAAYGKFDATGLRERARETLSSADLSLPGVMFQACAEAAALYA